jgi:hypothetical protein
MSMTTHATLRETLTALQEKMLIDFAKATKQIEHRGSKGHEREALIAKQYLEHYLPAGVSAIHGAEILDSEGNRSSECDLVIQAATTPPLYVSDSFRIIPVEWAHGLIEVKSKLDAKELRDSHAKIVKAKSLKKLTYQPQTGDIVMNTTVYGRSYNYFPMYGLVFAYSSTNLADLAKLMWELQEGTPCDTWVDAVVVLDTGMLMYRDADGQQSPRPTPGCKLAVIESNSALLPATLTIQSAFTGAWMPHATLGAYLGPEPWGNVTAICG